MVHGSKNDFFSNMITPLHFTVVSVEVDPICVLCISPGKNVVAKNVDHMYMVYWRYHKTVCGSSINLRAS